jgi:hypothetical protein
MYYAGKHKEEDIITLMPDTVNGGIDTIISIAQLFGIGIDSYPWPGPIVMVMRDMTEIDKKLLREMVKEYTKENKYGQQSM